jgi:uncharacterized protein
VLKIETFLVTSATLVALLLTLIMPSYVQAEKPSFDCSKARSWSEVTVCHNAELAGLDQQVAMLYRDTKAQLPGQQQETLKADQKSWLRQREGCRLQSDQTGCLFEVYKSRISQLRSSGETYPPSTRSKATEEGTTKRSQSHTTFAKDVVWNIDPSVIYTSFNKCDFGDVSCLLNTMQALGASREAIRFSQRLAANGTPGWALNFQELGHIDVVHVHKPFMANTTESSFLVNGSPDLIEFGYGLTASDRDRADVRKALGVDPTGYLFEERFMRRETTKGYLRYVTEAVLARCNACRNEALAKAEVAYDFDAKGSFKGATLLKIKGVEK